MRILSQTETSSVTGGIYTTFVIGVAVAKAYAPRAKARVQQAIRNVGKSN